MFRPLNDEERRILETLQTRQKTDLTTPWGNVVVQYFAQGNVIISLIEVNDRGAVNRLSAGYAKFNPNDKAFAQSSGENLAFSRAVKQWSEG